MAERSAIGVGVIGLGFMGGTHLAAYQAARRAGYRCRVVAACDSDRRRLRATAPRAGNIAGRAPFDPRQVRRYARAEELLADEEVQLVSVCTPTDTHVELTVAALAAGKHVLVEKPVALRAAAVRRVAAAARAAGRLCMPGMCVRFWPGWSWLKARIDCGTFGGVRSAVFQRLGSWPDWSPEFYRRAERSGAALFDLHIHDVDFIRWCFGDPDALVSTGSAQHLTTIYRYGRGPAHVVAEGGWVDPAGVAFRMRYLVVFERAAADFDLARDPALLLTRRGRTRPVPLEPLSGYELEIRHLLEAIREGRREPPVTLAEAEEALRLLEAERRSLRSGRTVRVARPGR